jgi:D-amino-acid oxidase
MGDSPGRIALRGKGAWTLIVVVTRSFHCFMTAQRTSRRDVAKWLAMSCALQPLLGACSRPLRLAAGTEPRSYRRLSRVLIAEHRVIRHVTGLRPFRRNGFRLEVESLGDKTLIHNYGHGGGGVSLSWGTAHLAVERALQTIHRQAAVVGCGAVGLATARLLQDSGFAVTIYARDLPPNTTSNIAGAQWSPVSVVDSDRRTASFDAQYERAARFAHRYFQNLVGPRYGITWRENYFLSEAPRRPRADETTLIADLLATVALAPNEHPFGRLHAARMLAMHIEPSVFLPAVLADARLAGARVVLRDFADAASIAQLPDPIIINCTGLGAAALFSDGELLPVKGQLTVLVPQPEVDYITIGPSGLYMMPRQDGIVLGGTFERGVSSLEPNATETERILRGHRALFEAME